MPTLPAAAQQTATPPDFSSNQTGWISVGNDLIQPAGAHPSIVRNDPAHPYVPNGTGAQPTYRVADLSNPNLKPWLKGRMKKSLFPPSFFGRANRGLLTEAKATKEAGASPATGTKRRSASALAAKQPTCLREAEASLRRRQANGAIKPEEGRSWCGVDGGARC
jgi:hypothetical protein